jgi:hypothetical protein
MDVRAVLLGSSLLVMSRKARPLSREPRAKALGRCALVPLPTSMPRGTHVRPMAHVHRMENMHGKFPTTDQDTIRNDP